MGLQSNHQVIHSQSALALKVQAVFNYCLPLHLQVNLDLCNIEEYKNEKSEQYSSPNLGGSPSFNLGGTGL